MRRANSYVCRMMWRVVPMIRQPQATCNPVALLLRPFFCSLRIISMCPGGLPIQGGLRRISASNNLPALRHWCFFAAGNKRENRMCLDNEDHSGWPISEQGIP